MSDGLDITSGIIAVLQLTQEVIQYLLEVKDANADRQRILNEITSVHGFLYILKDKAESSNACDTPLFNTLRTLNVADGPLEQFKSALERIATKVKPERGAKKVYKALKWPFEKGEVKELINAIERQKSFFGMALQNDHIALSEAIRRDVGNLADKLSAMEIGQKYQENRLRNEQSRKIVEWLSPVNFWIRQNDYCCRRHPQTGEWLLEDPAFKNWLEEGKESLAKGNRVLWCRGMPGAGKTILTSLVINYLEGKFSDNRNVGIAFIYCNYKESLTVDILLGSILQQVFQRRSDISSDLQKLYDAHDFKHTRPMVNELSILLQTELRLFSRMFIIVDALDECSEDNDSRYKLLAELQNLPMARIFITSRPHITEVRDFRFDVMSELEIRASDDDIRKYTLERISTQSRIRRFVEKDDNLNDEIANTIARTSNGMFLLAQLHLDSLSRSHTPNALRSAMKTLPKGLDETYDDALRRIDSQYSEDANLAKQVLLWISSAKRPLEIEELQYLVAIVPETQGVDDDDIPAGDLLISVCAGLVTIEAESRVVRLVHYTAQDYFGRRINQLFPDGHIQIASACLTYLLFERRSRTRAQYIHGHWEDHVRGPAEARFKQKLHCLFRSNLSEIFDFPMEDPFCSLLHFASILGFDTFLASILNDPNFEGDVDIVGPNGNTPLICAAMLGNYDVVKRLLDCGADCNRAGGYGITAVMAAVDDMDDFQESDEKVQVDLAKLLIKVGADLDAKDEKGRTALAIAARIEKTNVIKFLIDSGSDVNARDDYGRTPLFHIPFNQYGTVDAVRLLVRSGADINVQDDNGTTPLMFAIEFADLPSVQSLIEAGANLEVRDTEQRTPLCFAMDCDDPLNFCRVLIQAGVDINASVYGISTPLQHAIETNNADAVEVLMDAGADLYTQDENGELVLFEVETNWMNPRIAVLLSAYGPQISEDEDEAGGTDQEDIVSDDMDDDWEDEYEPEYEPESKFRKANPRE